MFVTLMCLFLRCPNKIRRAACGPTLIIQRVWKHTPAHPVTLSEHTRSGWSASAHRPLFELLIVNYFNISQTAERLTDHLGLIVPSGLWWWFISWCPHGRVRERAARPTSLCTHRRSSDYARSPLRAKITFLVRLNSHCDKDRWKQFNHDRKDIYNHVDTIWLLFHMTFLFLPPTSSEHQYQEYILVYSSSLMSMILSRGKI